MRGRGNPRDAERAPSVLDLVLVGWIALAVIMWGAVALGPLLTGRALQAPSAAAYLWLALVCVQMVWGAISLLRKLRSRD